MKLSVASLLKNKYVLYLVLFMAITNVLALIQRRDFESLTMMIAIGILASHFSKNMVIVLASAMLGSSIVTGSGLARSLFGMREGMENKDDSDDKESMKASKEEKDACEKHTDKDKCVKDSCAWDNGQCRQKKSEGFGQNNVPESKPASLGNDDDESDGKRIDYAATLEQAYDNLEKMLGSDGLKGLTNETKQLVGQQQNLMKTLTNMGPILNNAKDTLKDLNLPNVGQLEAMMAKLKK